MKVIIIAGLGLLSIMLIVLTRMGLFSKNPIVEKKVGPLLLAYVKHVGDYKNVGSKMDSLFWDLTDNYGIETTKGFGLYYDKPSEVETEKLRSIAGCILEHVAPDDLLRIKQKYCVAEFPESQSVVAEFPYRGKLSILLGMLKTYPRLHAYIQDNGHSSAPIMEIYDQPNEKIEYISSLSVSDQVFSEFLSAKCGQ